MDKRLFLGMGLLLLMGFPGCKGISLKDGYHSCDPQGTRPCPSGMTCAWSDQHNEYRCFREPPADAYVPGCGNGEIDS